MTKYHPHKVQLSDNQKKSLLDALLKKEGTTIRLKHEDLSGSDTLHLTETQIKKIKRAASTKKGVDLTMSKTQIHRTARFIKESAQAASTTQTQIQRSKKKIQRTARAGKGLQVEKAGSGLHINPPNYRPPPFIGSWGEKK